MLRAFPKVSWVALAAATILSADPAGAQERGFRLPLEVSQGAAVGAPGAITPYQVSVAALPGWAWPALRVSARLSLDYDNPSWRGRAGVRLSRRVVEMGASSGLFPSGVGLILLVEGSTTTDGDARLGTGLLFDADGLFRFGLQGGWEEIRDGAWFAVTVGFDPTRWSVEPDDDFRQGGDR